MPAAAARARIVVFFVTAIGAHGEPEEVVTDKAPVFARVIDELAGGAFHNTAQYANNRVECDHGRLKAGCDRCEASNATRRRASSCAVTR